MNKIKILTIAFSLLLFLASCDRGFEELNQDPNNPTEIESGLLIADIVRVSQNTLNSTFVGGDMGSCWSQQWAKVQYNDEERYSPRGSVIGMVWDDFYEDVAGDAQKMYELAVVEENKNMQGVALVLKAYGILILTDCYGDIPYTEALGKGEDFTPAYDKQSVVYDSILVVLDQANSLFASDGGTINAGSDILYGGDWSKWQKFGNSLKFRALMRISGTDKNVSAELQAIVDSRSIFTSNGDEAKLTYLSTNPNANPIYETIVYGTRGEFKVCDVLVDMLNGNNDPRLSVYVGENADGEYRGKPAGIFDVPNDDFNYENVSPVGDKYLEAEAPGYFMSYAELMFLMAEAAQKSYISGSAQDYYSAGIAASMSANDVSDYSGMSGQTLTGGLELQQIAEQNWLALYCQGVEAWTEQRRTGFPVLTPAREGVFDAIPSRYEYPSSEQSLNPDGWSQAKESQGDDELTTKIWWNK